jgi:hypothetical protein
MVDALAAETATAGRVVGAYRVALPRLAVAYRSLGELLVAVSDAPVIRTLGLLEPDVGRDWHEGESLAQKLLVDVAAVKEAAAIMERLEAFLVTPAQ